MKRSHILVIIVVLKSINLQVINFSLELLLIRALYLCTGALYDGVLNFRMLFILSKDVSCPN